MEKNKMTDLYLTINDGISDCCNAPSNSDIGRCKKCGELCNILNEDEL